MKTIRDPVRDVLIRKTDPGEAGDINPARHRLPDLVDITLGTWFVPQPERDVFDGRFSMRGGFLRLDMRVAGLVNPPGDNGRRTWQPFAFGPHPIYAFVELDMDDDVDTGGEVEEPGFRYLGNAVRFGGKPSQERFADRVARWASDYDLPFDRPPFVKRSGEEFHFVLLGHLLRRDQIREIEGNGNDVFESGEIWRIRAKLLHRAHGYRRLSFMERCSGQGEYEPVVDVQFAHDADADVTTISLVFPLTNVGSARMRGERPQEPNRVDCDQSSVMEALFELIVSANFWLRRPGGPPEKPIILGWAGRNPRHFLNPARWSVTALLGTSYIERPSGVSPFVWTDITPDVVRGDVNGDGVADPRDQRLIALFLAENGQRGVFDIEGFASNFNIFDVNTSGDVDEFDIIGRPRVCDTDGDDDVDLIDFAFFQRCFTGRDRPIRDPECVQVDVDRDRRIDLRDLAGFDHLLRGPDVR